MKIHSVANPIERDGVQSENTFSIKATAHSFEILSSGLYSNKPLACVRELSCNARDSHVEAGKGHIPFEIKLPNRMDPTFHVKDFGTGLSHEKVMKLYSTYFESTKTTSDDFIGQLGLGSKSPFSYTDSFTVESRYNGVVSIYSCYKNEDGLPAIALMGSTETEEPNGLTISMAIKSNDFDKFATATKQALRYFDVKPTIIGSDVTIEDVKYKLQTPEWALRVDNYYNEMGIQVIQGGVAYPVNVDVFKDDYPEIASISGINCDLFMPIGSVDVAASREALQYNKRTIGNLAVVLKKVVDTLVLELQQQLDACATDWDRTVLFAKWRDDSSDYSYYKLFRNVLSGHLTNSVGEKMSHQFLHFANNTGIGVSAYKSSYGDCKTIKDCSYIIPADTTIVLKYDNTKGRKQLAKALLDQKIAKTVIVLHPGETAANYTQANIDQVVANLGNVKLYDYSGVVIPKAQSTYTKRVPELRMVWQGPSDTDSSYTSAKCWNRQMTYLADGGVYVSINRYTATPKGMKYRNLEQVLKTMKAYGIDLPTIVGLNNLDLVKVEKDPKWIELTDYVDREFAVLNNNNALEKQFGGCKFIQSMGEEEVSRLLKVKPFFDLHVKNQHFMKCLREIQVAYDGYKHSTPRYRACQQYHVRALHQDTNVDNYHTHYVNTWKDMHNIAPLMDCINWSKVVAENKVHLIIDYINQHHIEEDVDCAA